MKQKLEELIDKAPPGHFHPKVKEKLSDVQKRVVKVAEMMEDLGLSDDRTNEVYVDENSLRKLLKEASPGSEDAVIAALKRIPGSKLATAGPGKRKIPWDNLAKRMPRMERSREAAVELNPYSSFEEIRQAVQQKFPDVQDDTFQPKALDDAFRKALEAPRAAEEALPGDIWNCMVRHFGWWGAIMLVTTAAVIIAVVLALLAIWASPILIGGTAFWGVFWLAFWAAVPPGILAGTGLATIGIIVRCVANPSA